MGRGLTRWRVASGVSAGRRHQKAGEACEDAVASVRTKTATAVSLADGAGSAGAGGVGASVATRVVAELLAGQFDAVWQADWLRARASIIARVRHAIEEEAARRERPIQELACTLLFAAVDGARFIAGHLGDGLVAVYDRGRWRALFEPHRGEHANETTFLTSQDPTQNLRLIRGQQDAALQGFALMSDGAAESLYDRRTRYIAPAIGTMTGWLSSGAESEVSHHIERTVATKLVPKTSDDCGLVLLSRVALSAPELGAREPGFFREFLGSGTSRGATNRLAVFSALKRGAAVPPQHIAQETGLSLRTVNGHLRALAALGDANAGRVLERIGSR